MQYTKTPQQLIDICAMRAGDPAKNLVRNEEWYSLFKESYNEILESDNEIWKFMMLDKTLATVSATAEYTSGSFLPTGTDFDVDNIIAINRAGFEAEGLSKISPQKSALLYGDGSGNKLQQPKNFYCFTDASGVRAIKVLPYPDGVYNYLVKYLAMVVTPALTAVMQIPDKYSYAVVYCMLSKKFPENAKFLNEYQRKYGQMVSDNEDEKAPTDMYFDPEIYHE